MYDNDFGEVAVVRSGNRKSNFFNNSLGTHFRAKSNEGWKFLYQILYQMVYTFIYIYIYIYMMPGLAAKDLFRFAILSSHFYKKTLKIEVSNKKRLIY